MPKPKVVEDYYGTRFEVEVIFKSAGPFVYVNRHPSEAFCEAGHQETMDRLTLGEARELAAQLISAADKASPQNTNNGAVAAPERSSQ